MHLIPAGATKDGELKETWINEHGKSECIKNSFPQRERAYKFIDQLKKDGFAASEIGFISPYRGQAWKKFGDPADKVKLVNIDEPNLAASFDSIVEGVDHDTVHKFQGQERRAIVYSSVVNNLNSFSDDPQLLNVAVSRAKDKFALIYCQALMDKEANKGNAEQKNLAALFNYMKALDPKEKNTMASPRCSIFDFLYCKGDRPVEAKPGESPAETAFRAMLYEALKNLSQEGLSLDFTQEYPLIALPRKFDSFTDDEMRFMLNGSRVDFIVFDSNTHDVVGVFEVDGVSFHGDQKPVQKRRDAMKDHILESIGIPLARFSTNNPNGRELERALAEMKSWIANPVNRSRISLDDPDFPIFDEVPF